MILKGIDREQWRSVAAYVDTLLLPIAPVKLVHKELHVDVSAPIDELASDLEEKLTGRLLLLPGISYIGQNQEVFKSYINEIIKEMVNSGFTYLIMLADRTQTTILAEVQEAFAEQTGLNIMIHTVESSEREPEAGLERTKEQLYQKVLEMWQNHS
ncbi:DUF2487 family protein [Laceyella putida]|uniref:DUF2487 family protein n=1 Tax=Laceyella putida TaxID=110101 RepID=A0ABW2RM93_9BACL